MAWKTTLLISAFLVTLTGCQWHEQIPVPEQRADFIGRWSDGDDYLELEPDGSVNLSIHFPKGYLGVLRGSLHRFDETTFCVGIVRLSEGDCWPISRGPNGPPGEPPRILLGGVELIRDDSEHDL